MSASSSSGRAAAESELLARLGLPPSASPEDVDQLHLAASQFLAAAPSGIKGWAHAQAAALDEAYLTLTDPVGLEGSALRSPTRPPTVVPGGPATPPARRGPVPAMVDAVELAPAPAAEFNAEPSAASEPLGEGTDDTDTDDLDALFASVTPGAHRDLTSGGKADHAAEQPPVNQPVLAGSATSGKPLTQAARRRGRTAAAQSAAPAAVPAPVSARPWKALAILASAGLLVAVVGLGVVPFVFNLGNAGGGLASDAATPTPSGPVVDMTRVAELMAKLQANPQDAATLNALGDAYFNGQQYDQAATFYDKSLAIAPKDIPTLLARGATYFNLGDSANAEKVWKQVVALGPTDKSEAQEVHYDLGFLYLNEASPNWASVQSEWNQVIAIDATTQIAQVVRQHLDSLVAASMIPGGSASPAAPGSPAASGSPVASGSAAPSVATPSASPAPSASAVSGVVTEGAQNLAFTSNQLTAPANSAFILRFDNQDSGLPHDILIKDATGNTAFKGDMITGPTSVDYQVPALAAGTYTFTCSIHPTTMNGTLVVGS